MSQELTVPVMACASGGAADRKLHSGRNLYTGKSYCERCWTHWEMSSAPGPTPRAQNNLQFNDPSIWRSLFRTIGAPKPGWEPNEMLDPNKLEELALIAAYAHAGEVPIINAHCSGFDSIQLETPCIIRNAVNHWPCLGWVYQEFLDRLGSIRVPWKPCFGDWKHQVMLGAASQDSMRVVDYFNSVKSHPGILFDQDDPMQLIHKTLRDSHDVPSVLSPIHRHRETTKPIFSAGRFNTGVGFHSHMESWLAQVHGRKLWWIVPRGQSYGEIEAPWQYLLPGQCPQHSLFCMVHPGEVLYLPEEWAHATWNIDNWSMSLGYIGVCNGMSSPHDHIMQWMRTQMHACTGFEKQDGSEVMRQPKKGTFANCVQSLPKTVAVNGCHEKGMEGLAWEVVD